MTESTLTRPSRGHVRVFSTCLSILVALALLLGPGLSVHRASGAALAPDPQESVPLALVMAPVSSAKQIAGLVRAGLVVYGAPLSSAQGEYVLAGAPAEALKRLPADAAVKVLDADMAGGVYYLAYPPPASDQRAGALRWAEYGTVLLDLGDQVLLRTGEAEMIRLADAGAEVVRVMLEPGVVRQGIEAGPEAITPDPRVAAMLSQVTTQGISDYTAQLSGETPVTIGGAPYTISSRYTYSGEPVQKAGQFVGERMQALGLGVEYHVWGSSGTPSTYPNVIGQRTGTTNPNDIYIIGGHLDNLPSSGLAYGADDNGSGSVATLLAAQILTQYEWSCTLRFAFWTGEEQGLLGSAAYATRAKNANEAIKGYLNMDMIAYNGSAPNEIDLFAKSTVPGSVAMMDLYADAIAAYGLNLVPTKYTNDTLGDRSDNKSFWDKGYASMLAIEDYYGDFNPRYHTVNDRLQYLDMAYYTAFVKASLATFAHMTGCLISPTPTPTAAPTNTATATSTWTPTNTATWTPTTVPTNTPTTVPTNTPTTVPTNTPTTVPTNTPTTVPTNTPTTVPTNTPTTVPTNTPTTVPTNTPTTVPTNTPTTVPTNTPTTVPTNTPTPTPTATSTPVPVELFYLSSTTGGTAGGVAFADEDILTFNRNTGVWSMFFDGSDVGVAGVDIDAFSLQPDGSILLSFDAAITLGSLGTVADADIVRFVPTSTGSTTAGVFQWYFDGSDVGLSDANEDIDAIALTPDGKLVISTVGAVAVTGVSGADEDLLVFTATQLGETTSGTWAMYFDGSDVGLSTTASEDINGAWIEPGTGKIYLTTLGAFSVAGVTGDGADVFICTPSSLGPTTACTFVMYWVGSANGYAGEVLDALEITR